MFYLVFENLAIWNCKQDHVWFTKCLKNWHCGGKKKKEKEKKKKEKKPEKAGEKNNVPHSFIWNSLDQFVFALSVSQFLCTWQVYRQVLFAQVRMRPVTLKVKWQRNEILNLW